MCLLPAINYDENSLKSLIYNPPMFLTFYFLTILGLPHEINETVAGLRDSGMHNNYCGLTSNKARAQPHLYELVDLSATSELH